MTLQMLCSEQSEDLRGVKTHLNSLLPSSSKQVCDFFSITDINYCLLRGVLLILDVCVLLDRFIQEMKLLKTTLSGLFKTSWRTQEGESSSSRCVSALLVLT